MLFGTSHVIFWYDLGIILEYVFEGRVELSGFRTREGYEVKILGRELSYLMFQAGCGFSPYEFDCSKIGVECAIVTDHGAKTHRPVIEMNGQDFLDGSTTVGLVGCDEFIVVATSLVVQIEKGAFAQGLIS